MRDAYPAGDEFILVYDVLAPRHSAGRHPAGRRRRGDERRNGRERGRLGQQPVTEKFLTIAGAVAEPVTLRVPIGVTLAAVRGRGRRSNDPGRQLHGRRRDDGHARSRTTTPWSTRPPAA